MNIVFFLGCLIGVILSIMLVCIWSEFKSFLNKVVEQKELIKQLNREINDLKWEIKVKMEDKNE